MATSWKSQQGNGEYALQFETDDKRKYKLVEKAAQMAVDGKVVARYIDIENVTIPKGFFEDLNVPKLLTWLASQPTADVQEVVKCKDCANRYIPTRCALWFGSLDDKEYFLERGDDFHCAFGTRKRRERVGK